MISAHRGGSDLGITSNDDMYLHFKRAVEFGAELVEFDVRRTKDGVFVSHHDEAIEGLGDIADVDSSALQEHESIIPVASLLTMAAGKTICHIDLKSTGDEIALVDSAIDILGPEGFVITSLEAGSVARIRRERPEVQAILTLGRGSRGMRLADVLRVRVHELIPFKAIRECHATGVAVEWRLATPPLLRYARRHGLTVMVWTVNKDWQIRHFLRNKAVDIVITDRPAAAMAIRRGDGQREKGRRVSDNPRTISPEQVVVDRVREKRDFFDSHGTRARVGYRTLRIVSLLAGTSVTVAAGLGASKWLTAALGASIVVIEGTQQLWGYHERWVRYKSAAAALDRELYLYRELAGSYADHGRPHALLGERAETIIYQEHSKFLTVQSEVDDRSSRTRKDHPVVNAHDSASHPE